MSEHVQLESTLIDERRGTWRCDQELPMRWCRLPACVDGETLANAVGLTDWYRRDNALAELEDPLNAAISQISDAATASAIRTLFSAVQRLTTPAENEAPGRLTPMNLSVDGISFTVPEAETHMEPGDWLGLVITLPGGYPLMTCVEVIWVGHANEHLHIGGRFHHVHDRAAKKLARHMLLSSTH